MKTNDESVKQKNRDENTFESSEVHDHGRHPNSLANLKPFPKGISGNPLGRRHRFEKLANALNEIGDKEALTWDEKPMGYSYREGVLETIWTRANKGEIKYVQMLAWLGCLE